MATASWSVDSSDSTWRPPWTESLSIPILDDWLPGAYLLKLVASTGQQRWVPLTVRDDAGVADVRFQFDGPGQAYVEGDLAKGFALHTTGAGALTARVFVTGRRGTTGEATLRLQIDARR